MRGSKKLARRLTGTNKYRSQNDGLESAAEDFPWLRLNFCFYCFDTINGPIAACWMPAPRSATSNSRAISARVSVPCETRSRTCTARRICVERANSGPFTLAQLISGAGFPDLASIRAKIEEMDAYYIDIVSSITQQDLDRVIRYKGFTGDEFSNPLWQSLHQLTNHASYHRGQVVTMMRQLGSESGLHGFDHVLTASKRAPRA